MTTFRSSTRPRSRGPARLGGIALATATLLTACSSADDSDNGSDPDEERVVRLASEEFGFPSPFAATRPGFTLTTLQYDTLLWRDGEDLRPWLAEDVELSDGGTEVQVTLRDDITFSDGEPITSDDVAFSVDYLRENPMVWSVRLDVIDGVRVIDDRELVIELTDVYVPFFDNDLSALPVLPQHIWEDVEDPAEAQDTDLLVGSGAYEMDDFDMTAGTYRLTARDDYFLGDPYIDVVEFAPVGEPLAALRAGDVDGVNLPVEQGMEPGTLEQFEDDDEYTVITGGGSNTVALQLNLEDGPAADPQFREALATAIDPEEFVSRLLDGQGTPGSLGYLPEGNPWHADGLPTYGADPEAAADIVPDGATLEVLVDAEKPRVGELLRDQLGAAGIEVTLVPLDPTTLRDRAAEGQYQAALLGFGGVHSDPSFVLGNFDSRVERRGSFTRAIGYQNPELESLLDQQQRTLDPDERQDQLAAIQEILATDLAVLPLYYPDRVFAATTSPLDAWYFTPGGFAGGNPGAVNKALLITGTEGGLDIAG